MRRILCLGLLLLLSVFAGCAPAAEPASAPSSPEVVHTAPRTVPDGIGSGADDGVFPRTVKHFSGESVIPAAPQRVVALSTGQLDGLLALEVEVVGTTRAKGAELIPAYLPALYPELAEKLKQATDLGERGEPKIEAIAALTPDLILINSTADPEVLGQLTKIAPTVVTEGTGVNWKQDFLLIADAVGQTQAAQTLLDQFHSDAAALGQGLDAKPTVSLTSVTAERTRIFGVASFAGSILEDAGLPRPESQQFADTSIDLSPEQFDLAGAGWIFVGAQGGEETAAGLTSSPLWQELPAVQGKQVVFVDNDPWFLNAGPSAARLVLTDLETKLR